MHLLGANYIFCVFFENFSLVIWWPQCVEKHEVNIDIAHSSLHSKRGMFLVPVRLSKAYVEPKDKYGREVSPFFSGHFTLKIQILHEEPSNRNVFLQNSSMKNDEKWKLLIMAAYCTVFNCSYSSLSEMFFFWAKTQMSIAVCLRLGALNRHPAAWGTEASWSYEFFAVNWEVFFACILLLSVLNNSFLNQMS